VGTAWERLLLLQRLTLLCLQQGVGCQELLLPSWPGQVQQRQQQLELGQKRLAWWRRGLLQILLPQGQWRQQG
jgi:hypothetical protein